VIGRLRGHDVSTTGEVVLQVIAHLVNPLAVDVPGVRDRDGIRDVEDAVESDGSRVVEIQACRIRRCVVRYG